MTCNSIEEYSILFLENKLGSKESNLLKNHINICSKCRLMFNLIKANYHPEEAVAEKSVSLAVKLDRLIDRDLYPASKGSPTHFSLKKFILASIIVVLCIIATVNAKTIYKTYKELVSSMFINSSRLETSNTIHKGTYSDEAYVKTVYEKHRNEIEAMIAGMKTAETASLEFVEDGKSFEVRISKGIKGNFISYGFTGYTVYYNEFFRKYQMNRANETIMEGRSEYNTVDELLHTVGMAPVPGYIPDGFDLICTFQNTGRDRMTPLDAGLYYKNSDGYVLGIRLTRSKMLVTNADAVPEKHRDTLIFTETTGFSGQGSASTIKEVFEIGQYQAVYSEGKISIKGNPDRTFQTISIFLGDNAKFPILEISSNILNKVTMKKVAESIEISTLSENIKQAADYFKGIEDEKILAYADKYLSNIGTGITEFQFNVDANTEFYKTSKNDTYYIMYRNCSIDSLKSSTFLDINLREEFLKRFEYANIQIIGQPYLEDKEYNIELKNTDKGSISIHKSWKISFSGDLELTDLLIARKSGTTTEMKPLFTNSGHLYYLIDTGNGGWVLQTIYEKDSALREYNFSIDKKIMPDEEAVMDFINSL